MFLVELGDEAVLAEDLFVVGSSDPYKIVEFVLDLGVPVLIIIQQLWVQVVAEQRAVGGADIAELTDLGGEDVAASFVAVKSFHFFNYLYSNKGKQRERLALSGPTQNPLNHQF